MLYAREKTPVDSNMMMVKSMREASESGSPLAAAMRLTSQRRFQRSSMGSVGDQRVAMLAQLISRSDHVMVQ